MSKIWRISDKFSPEFKHEFPEFDELTLQLLWNRGFKDRAAIEEFFDLDYSARKHDPFLFKNMRAAVDLIIDAIKTGKKIVVYGDYDADGVTSSTVMSEVLGTLHGQVEVFIPDRVSEGYGLNKEVLTEIAEAGVQLLITVDNGIRSKELIDYAQGLGVTVIVTDHHVPPEEVLDLPNCLVINPIVPSETYPFKYLAGVGTAFKLAAAIIQSTKLDEESKNRLEERCLDIVAIGTVADCVPLIGENRLLVKRGLEIMNRTKRPGLLSLFEVTKIKSEKVIDAWNIGFQIAPRLNAAGRMEHANTAFQLLNTKDKEEAMQIAQSLNETNVDRQKETEAIVREAEVQIQTQLENKILICLSPSITENGEPWNEGVVGLAAGRLMERYYLPVLLITGDTEEMKGSGRSISEFNLIKAIEEIHESLARYGGHAAACGFSLAGQENLLKFKAELTALANRQLAGMELKPKVKIEAEVPFHELDEEFIARVDKFAPFGESNPRPNFLSKSITVVDMINLGADGKHLKLRLKNSDSNVKSALGFGQADRWPDLRIGDKIDIVYYVEINEFNGRREVQLRIIDLKQAGI